MSSGVTYSMGSYLSQRSFSQWSLERSQLDALSKSPPSQPDNFDLDISILDPAELHNLCVRHATTGEPGSYSEVPEFWQNGTAEPSYDHGWIQNMLSASRSDSVQPSDSNEMQLDPLDFFVDVPEDSHKKPCERRMKCKTCGNFISRLPTLLRLTVLSY